MSIPTTEQEPFTADTARCLAQRLELGVSVLDEDGNERVVQGRPRPATAPTWQQLLARFGGQVPADEPARAERVRRARDKARAEADERERAEAERLDLARKAAEERILARVEERAAARKALACYPADPMAHEAGSDVAAARLCHAARAFVDCAFAHPATDCPRGRLDLAYGAQRDRLQRGEVPAGFVDVLLAALPGHRVEGKRVAPVPLEARPAGAVIRAWLTRQPAAALGVALTGLESLLVLEGAMRCGKSLGAAWALSQAPCEPDAPGRWITASDLAGMRAGAFAELDVLGPRLLVIDDAGTEALGEWGRSRLFGVLSDRHAAKRLTLITTNVERAAFGRRYDGTEGGRLDRRISEAGKWVRLPAWRAA